MQDVNLRNYEGVVESYCIFEHQTDLCCIGSIMCHVALDRQPLDLSPSLIKNSFHGSPNDWASVEIDNWVNFPLENNIYPFSV